MINLVVGDVHCTPNELGDCEALLGLVEKVAIEEKVSRITFMGDQYHNHSVVDVRCLEFWHRWLDRLDDNGRSIYLLVGNHDQVTPTCGFPHAMLSHDSESVFIVDKPEGIAGGIGLLPYYHDSKEFLGKANELKTSNPEIHTLFCHQTISGAKYETGFYVKDAVECDQIPFRHVISGHIHTPQTVGNKVCYVGAPRWRTLSDAGSSRYLWVFEHTPEGTKLKKRTPTDTVCRRIYRFIDRENEPAVLTIPEELKALADIRVDVYGDSEYISRRTIELKASFGARCRGFPERVRVAQVSESEGIGVAFSQFAQKFEAPNKTPQELLLTTVQERLR
jgi:DNA repair exonuclease SbcCD nuclease subunit